MTISNNSGLDVPKRNDNDNELSSNSPLIEVEKEDTVEALAKQRSFRDKFIEDGEKSWNTTKRQIDTIKREQEKLRKGLSKYDGKIVDGIKTRQIPLQQIEELPAFLTNCAVDKEIIDILVSAMPLETQGVSPRIKCWVVALYESINSFCKNPALLSEETFSATFVQTFGKIREKNFVADETNHLKYLDTLGTGFYSSPEGQKSIYEKAAETVNPATAVDEAA